MNREYEGVNLKKYDNNNNSNYILIIIRNKIHNIGHIKQRNGRCKSSGKRTNYICIECDISLHPECFNYYHYKNVYNKK